MERELKRRISKPVGIYVFTIIIFIRLGLFEFLNYWYSIQNSEGNVPFIMVFVPLFLCTFTAGAAVWAFYGDDTARIALLIFVSLNVLWMTFLFISAIGYSESDGIEVARLIPILFQPVAWLIATWWYFTKSDVVAYYKQQSLKSENESN